MAINNPNGANGANGLNGANGANALNGVNGGLRGQISRVGNMASSFVTSLVPANAELPRIEFRPRVFAANAMGLCPPFRGIGPAVAIGFTVLSFLARGARGDDNVTANNQAQNETPPTSSADANPTSSEQASTSTQSSSAASNNLPPPSSADANSTPSEQASASTQSSSSTFTTAITTAHSSETPQPSPSPPSNTPTPISTAQDLAGMQADGNYILTQDIDMTNTTLSITNFNGQLDGNGHTVSGLSQCLIENIGYGIVTNLNIVSANITTSDNDKPAGAIACVNFKGVISHSQVTNSSIQTLGDGSFAGAVVGSSEGFDFDLTASNNTIKTSGDFSDVGGISGVGSRGNHQDVSSSHIEAKGNFANAGGIAGRAYRSHYLYTTKYSTLNNTIITQGDNAHAGGCFGKSLGSLNCLETTSSLNNITTTGNGSCAGGVVGLNSAQSKLINLRSNDNNITTSGNGAHAGSAIGHNQGTAINLSSGHNKITTHGNGANAGGAVGFNNPEQTDRPYVNNFSNSNLVAQTSSTHNNITTTGSSSNVGGSVGQNLGLLTQATTSHSTIISQGADAQAGGICGSNSRNSSIVFSHDNNISSHGDAANAGGIHGRQTATGATINFKVEHNNVNATGPHSHAGKIYGENDNPDPCESASIPVGIAIPATAIVTATICFATHQWMRGYQEGERGTRLLTRPWRTAQRGVRNALNFSGSSGNQRYQATGDGSESTANMMALTSHGNADPDSDYDDSQV